MPPISLVETSSDLHCDLRFFLLSPSSSPDPPSDISELHPGMKAPPALSCLLPLILHRHCCWCLVAKSCPTLCDPTDCSPPGSSVHGISQARVLEWVPFPFAGDLLTRGIKPASGFFTTGPPGKSFIGTFPTVIICTSKPVLESTFQRI